MAVAEDAFFPEGRRECVRFTNNFTRNINKQPFDVIRFPELQGVILQIPNINLEVYESVTIQLDKINENNVGLLKVTYRNACFNSLGFCTHDTHIPL